MKRLPLILVLLVVVVAAVVAVRLLDRPSATEAADARLDTEVAVRVGVIERATLRAYVTAYGTVEPEPAGERPAAAAKVAPSVPGVVVAVQAVEGRSVARGEQLFQLDSRAADVAVDFAAKTVERQERLLEVEGTSRKALQEAEQQLDAARVDQALLRVKSPLAGTVVRVNVKPGEAVDLTTVLAEIVDLDRLVVGAMVPSSELVTLELGQTAEVLAGGSAPPIAGIVSYIGSEVDAQTGTALVRAALPAGSGLRPGQFVTIRIVSAEHPDRLAVPVESVVEDEDGAAVIAIVDHDTATQRAVTTGLRDDGLVEIEANGLQAGMTVVTEGAYGLPRQTRVRILGR